ncbi:MAG: hypothetical protein IJ856_00180 [Candidatus Methanomethylophilaceae archaeon]|nr:hypothetical protein [Candidatus Methanomethylophilaceae archaeon]
MTDERYGRCRVCRFCRHEGDSWTCVPEDRPTMPDSSCGRYRPGCCEYCGNYVAETCRLTGAQVYPLEVCDDYDPSFSRWPKCGPCDGPIRS